MAPAFVPRARSAPCAAGTSSLPPGFNLVILLDLFNILVSRCLRLGPDSCLRQWCDPELLCREVLGRGGVVVAAGKRAEREQAAGLSEAAFTDLVFSVVGWPLCFIWREIERDPVVPLLHPACFSDPCPFPSHPLFHSFFLMLFILCSGQCSPRTRDPEALAPVLSPPTCGMCGGGRGHL